MNTFTDKSEFTETAQHILDNSDLLIKSDCMIVDDVLYEQLGHMEDGSEEPGYRFFFNTDDYDYLEDATMIARLDSLYAAR